MGQKTVLLTYLSKHITVLAPKERVFDDAKDVATPGLHEIGLINFMTQAGRQHAYRSPVYLDIKVKTQS